MSTDLRLYPDRIPCNGYCACTSTCFTTAVHPGFKASQIDALAMTPKLKPSKFDGETKYLMIKSLINQSSLSVPEKLIAFKNILDL